ncbi:MAG: serine protease [Thermoleophilaceae bacterium]|jgi:subtilisin family serine protease|nr:serine protease [Thermoleophilaceae bacterium]
MRFATSFRLLLLPIAGVVVAVGSLIAPAYGASVRCSERPSDPAGYAVTTVRADQVAATGPVPAIAVLDTGVADVPELSGRVRPGYDVTDRSERSGDIDGHGTAVAAIAAAAAGGVRGIAPTAPILPIKIFDDAGNSSAENFLAGLERAVAQDAGVINVSAAGTPGDLDAATKASLTNAIDAAVTLGIPVIAASGNEGAGSLDVPAAFPHVIAVGATQPSGDVAPFSNFGSGLDLVAPGADIVTAAPSALCASGYGTVSGTSFAAPAVAGAAALLLQKHPGLDVSQLTDLLRLRGLRRPAPGWTIERGFGMLDVAAALAAPVPDADVAEVNDDVHWARLQSAALAPPKRTRALTARIAPHSDPSDVYRVRLNKKDRFRASLSVPSGSDLRLSFGSSKLKRVTGRTISKRITRGGTYFVGVTIARSDPAGATYRLTLKR